ncbi:unnamed protein product [Sphenostylis stenocarpa]|uniref:Uncharacterized protein n=1 Tax=Sphenostylis stenocarpa TaxID=92480 RepID=A0AA86SZB4_9FABA|nr:unnamed protein product [Sphenostylis stenocarpa]
MNARAHGRREGGHARIEIEGRGSEVWGVVRVKAQGGAVRGRRGGLQRWAMPRLDGEEGWKIRMEDRVLAEMGHGENDGRVSGR